MELFCGNSLRVKAVCCLRRGAPSLMLDGMLNATLSEEKVSTTTHTHIHTYTHTHTHTHTHIFQPRKSLVICATQLAGGLLLEKLKYFEVMLNIF